MSIEYLLQILVRGAAYLLTMVTLKPVLYRLVWEQFIDFYFFFLRIFCLEICSSLEWLMSSAA